MTETYKTLEDVKIESEQAVPILIEKHGYSADSFTLADGEETIGAPEGIDPALGEHGYSTPLPGTPGVWEINYMYGDGDFHTAAELLEQIGFWENFDYSEYEN